MIWLVQVRGSGYSYLGKLVPSWAKSTVRFEAHTFPQAISAFKGMSGFVTANPGSRIAVPRQTSPVPLAVRQFAAEGRPLLGVWDDKEQRWLARYTLGLEGETKGWWVLEDELEAVLL